MFARYLGARRALVVRGCGGVGGERVGVTFQF